MKSIDVTVKGLKETTRDRRGFLFILGFPILLIALFAFAFGSGSFLTGGSLPHNIVVVNEDAGVKLVANNTTKSVNYGNNFIQVLTNATSENSSTHLFTLNNASAAKADDMLKSRNIDAIITIPNNFSAAFVTMVNNSTRIAIESSVGQQQLASTSNLTPVFDPVTGTFITPSPTATTSVLIPANVTLPAAGNTTSSLIIQGDAA